jgi:hypothetical protein
MNCNQIGLHPLVDDHQCGYIKKKLMNFFFLFSCKQENHMNGKLWTNNFFIFNKIIFFPKF